MRYITMTIEIKGFEDKGRIIEMKDMEPLQVARVVDNSSAIKKYKNHIVMRTASIDNFEVFSITASRPDACWTNNDCTVSVVLLDTPIEIKITND